MMVTTQPIYNSSRRRWLHLSLILATLLAAAWLRLWQLPDLPPGFYYDEAYNAMDGIWMRDARSPQVYFVGDTGRHAMMPYLLALATTLWGVRPYAARLVAPWVGILLVALLYRLSLTLFADRPDRRWLGLVAAGGQAFSLWHVIMSRSAYEVPLVPFFVVLTTYLFWRGWQRRSLWHFAWAGIALGLSQYSYVSARLLPLVFGLFVALQSVMVTCLASASVLLQQRGERRRLWFGLLIMAATAFVVFLPLGLFILNDPGTFFFRSRDVFIFTRVARGEVNASEQLLDALRIFFDSYSPTWRHNIVGQSGFTWLDLIGFGIGLVVAVKHFRQPNYLFLLVGLLVMWLPAPLSAGTSPFRLSGLLPLYYLLVAVGLLTLPAWLAQKQSRWSAELPLKLSLIALVFVVNGGSTTYGYFVRWANEPTVYHDYHGPLSDMAYYALDTSRTSDILLPFEVYTHPTVRFILYNEFREVSEPPPATPGRPLVLVKQLETPPLALVWLTRSEEGQGLVYVTRPQPLEIWTTHLAPTGETLPLRSSVTGQTIASLTPFASIEPLLPRLTDWRSIQHVDYRWGDQLRLFGYEVWPAWVQSGQAPVLNLYWQSLVGQPYPRTHFIQLLNQRGEPIGQWTDSSLADQHRWRTGGTILDHHILWLSPQTVPGPYLVRMGLFDFSSNRRVPIYLPNGNLLGDQVLLGLFYVADGATDPRLPQIPRPAQLGAQIELLGYSLLPRPADAPILRVQLHWQANGQIATDYTAFVQLLDAQGQRVAGWDSQPLAGQYPTSRWQPGEIVVDTFDLPLPNSLPPSEYRLVTGMYDLATGKRLPAVDTHGQLLPDDMITLTQQALP